MVKPEGPRLNADRTAYWHIWQTFWSETSRWLARPRLGWVAFALVSSGCSLKGIGLVLAPALFHPPPHPAPTNALPERRSPWPQSLLVGNIIGRKDSQMRRRPFMEGLTAFIQGKASLKLSCRPVLSLKDADYSVSIPATDCFARESMRIVSLSPSGSRGYKSALPIVEVSKADLQSD